MEPASESEAGVAAALRERIDRVHRTNEAEFTFADWIREQLDPSEAQPDVDEIELFVWQHIADLVPMPGVHEAIAMLRDESLPMGVVSNAIVAARTLGTELERHGLREDLSFLISSADESIRKPAEKIFQRALSRLGANADDVWFVGDSWDNDVVGAARAGMHPVWLNRDRGAQRDEVGHQRVSEWPDFCSLWRSVT